MYSVPEHVNDTQEIYSVLLDGNEWKAQSYIQHHSNITFYYTVLFYDQCLKAGYQAADGVKFKKWAQEHSLPILSDWAEKAYADVHAIDHYPDWLYSYFKKYSGRDFESMEVRKITVAFDGNRFHPIKEEPLFKIDELE